jgi:hypothetical protein
MGKDEFMAGIDGQWDSVAQSPMGEQRSVLTLTSKPDGSFVGTNAGPMGTLDITEGQVTGDQLTFKMELKVPFPMTLACEGALNGDVIEGTIDTGAFGRFPVKATRKA